jgi:hypothetical protein
LGIRHPFFFANQTTKKEALFFSNEELNLLVVLPNGKFINMFLVYTKTEVSSYFISMLLDFPIV